VFCCKAICGIGTLPDTIADRSISIRLKRRRAAETVERFRLREVEPGATELRSRLAAWLEPHLDALADARSELPDASTTGPRTDGSPCSRSPIWPAVSGPREHDRRRWRCRPGARVTTRPTGCGCSPTCGWCSTRPGPTGWARRRSARR
jgi:hypothetical protein